MRWHSLVIVGHRPIDRSDHRAAILIASNHVYVEKDQPLFYALPVHVKALCLANSRELAGEDLGQINLWFVLWPKKVTAGEKRGAENQ
jgi:hypothetical protein